MLKKEDTLKEKLDKVINHRKYEEQKQKEDAELLKLKKENKF